MMCNMKDHVCYYVVLATIFFIVIVDDLCMIFFSNDNCIIADVLMQGQENSYKEISFEYIVRDFQDKHKILN